MKIILTIFVLTLPLFINAAEIKELSLTRCTEDALLYSPSLSALGAQVKSAKFSETASKSAYYPSIDFVARGTWVSEVPELQIMNITQSFGDNWGYSVGPEINYILFDYKGRSGSEKSAASALASAQDEYEFAKKGLVLNVRQAYFAVQQSLERIYLSSEQLALARRQLQDVNSAFKAGSKSNLDVSMAQKQELRAQINLTSARSALGVNLRELFRLTGTDYGLNPSYPSDWRVSEDNASTLIKADPLEQTLALFLKYYTFDFDENSSKITSIAHMADYYKYLAQSMGSSLYPTIALSGGGYAEYPNGPIKEHVLLARAGAYLTFPLFEGSKTRSLASAQSAQGESMEFQKSDTLDSLKKLFYSSKSVFEVLLKQTALTKQMIDASNTSAKLTYDAYKAGTLTFLEVDSANVSLLESKISLADIYIEQLNRLAVIDNLGRGDK